MRYFLPLVVALVGCAPVAARQVGEGWCDTSDAGETIQGCDPGPRPDGGGWIQFNAVGTPTHWDYFTVPGETSGRVVAATTPDADFCASGFSCGWVQGPTGEDLSSIEASCAATPRDCFVPIGD